MDELKDRGRAYGDPLRALGVLNERLKNTENELLELTSKRKAFLDKQAAEEVMRHKFAALKSEYSSWMSYLRFVVVTLRRLTALALRGADSATTVTRPSRTHTEDSSTALYQKFISTHNAQPWIQAADGRILIENAEFAEREASVAARAERMARRTGLGGPDVLAECERKTRDCEVVLR